LPALDGKASDNIADIGSNCAQCRRNCNNSLLLEQAVATAALYA